MSDDDFPGATQPEADQNVPPTLCPNCCSTLFSVKPGVTTAAEIVAFAMTAKGWRDNPEAIDGWMPPGVYCANGCYAIHATPIPVFDNSMPAPARERIPRPVRITLADVMRDGGSYRLDYESNRGEAISALLRVITEGALRRVGYQAPRLSRCDPQTHEKIESWDLDWDEAEQLAGKLRPLLVTSGAISVGSVGRAREMILLLRRRGGV